ncbi:MAG: hypothetical protein FJX68_10950 [Alphaproteobacteria bacterium]|nr:hypothetical protein [Alphaproteobacteria bacterium]
MPGEPPIVIVDSVTRLGPEHKGAVLFGGSHGGVYAGYLAAKAKVHAVILSDAGVGKDRAGIGSLAFLDRIGMAAVTVGHDTGRIGDGQDQASNGRISHVNQAAAAAGAKPGMPAMDCARLLAKAKPPAGEVPAYEESRFLFSDRPGEAKVWGIDSASLVKPEDAGSVVITASHGALLAGDTGSAIKYDVLASAYNDAGVGKDRVGISRLPALDRRGIGAVTVDCMTARIGDARSAWETGRVSHCNETARAWGVKPGMSLPEFAALASRHSRK